jgi:hypothetical protein
MLPFFCSVDFFLLISLCRSRRATTQSELSLPWASQRHFLDLHPSSSVAKRRDTALFNSHTRTITFLERHSLHTRITPQGLTGSTRHRDPLSSIRNINRRSTPFVTFRPTFLDSAQRDETETSRRNAIQRYSTLNTYSQRRIWLNIDEASHTTRAGKAKGPFVPFASFGSCGRTVLMIPAFGY